MNVEYRSACAVISEQQEKSLNERNISIKKNCEEANGCHFKSIQIQFGVILLAKWDIDTVISCARKFAFSRRFTWNLLIHAECWLENQVIGWFEGLVIGTV